MKPALLWLLSFLLSAAVSTSVPASEIKDGSAAIKRAQHICRLETQNRVGRWQAILVKDKPFGDEWHVWFGKDRVEPVCGFYGAVVKADGSYTSCRVSACAPAPVPRPEARTK